MNPEEQDNQSQENNTIDKQYLLNLFNKTADDKAKSAYERKLTQENEIFELYNGVKTSITKEKEKLEKILEDIPQNHEPKFSQFFSALGVLLKWSEEERNAYHKPPIAARTINEVIYDRFPKTVILHIHGKNPYIKWCTRAHKNYLFLGDNGILLLERFIDDAVVLLRQSESLYDFRMKHATNFGTGFQPILFEEYCQSL